MLPYIGMKYYYEVELPESVNHSEQELSASKIHLLIMDCLNIKKVKMVLLYFKVM